MKNYMSRINELKNTNQCGLQARHCKHPTGNGLIITFNVMAKKQFVHNLE